MRSFWRHRAIVDFNTAVSKPHFLLSIKVNLAQIKIIPIYTNEEPVSIAGPEIAVVVLIELPSTPRRHLIGFLPPILCRCRSCIPSIGSKPASPSAAPSATRRSVAANARCGRPGLRAVDDDLNRRYNDAIDMLPPLSRTVFCSPASMTWPTPISRGAAGSTSPRSNCASPTPCSYPSGGRRLVEELSDRS